MRINIVNLGRMDYMEALEIQERLHGAVQHGRVEDTLLLVEHPPVITVGRNGKQENILISSEELHSLGVRVYNVSRGGDVTYHGPGQIVGYPIMDLKNYGRSIKGFVERIEKVFISLLDKEYGISAEAGDDRYTGVWVGNEKITAIGIAVKRWVTMHGFAFNVNTQLEHFKWIVPCGLSDRGVTSLEKLTGIRQDYDKLVDMTAQYFCKVFDITPEKVEKEEILIRIS